MVHHRTRALATLIKRILVTGGAGFISSNMTLPRTSRTRAVAQDESLAVVNRLLVLGTLLCLAAALTGTLIH